MSDCINIYREDRCLICKQDRCLELYDNNNNPLNFSYMVDTNRYDKLDMKNISHMKCKKCNKEFIIEWVLYNNKLKPKPLYNTFDHLIKYASIRNRSITYKPLKSLIKGEK